MVQRRGLRTRLGVLSGTGSSVLWGSLVSGRGARRLGLMHWTRMMRERLWSIDALLWSLWPLPLCLELRGSRRSQSLSVRTSPLADHARPSLQHGVHGVLSVGGHGLDDLLLAVLLGVVLQVGLRVRRGHQRSPRRRGLLDQRRS